MLAQQWKDVLVTAILCIHWKMDCAYTKHYHSLRFQCTTKVPATRMSKYCRNSASGWRTASVAACCQHVWSGQAPLHQMQAMLWIGMQVILSHLHCKTLWTCTNCERGLEHEGIRGALLAPREPKNVSRDWCMSNILCNTLLPLLPQLLPFKMPELDRVAELLSCACAPHHLIECSDCGQLSSLLWLYMAIKICLKRPG